MQKATGARTNIEYLASVHLASPHLCAAHCVWVDDRDQQLLADHDIKVMHCPGSNLKLGSGHCAGRGDARARRSPCRLAPTAPRATTTSTCSRKCGSRPMLQAMRKAAGHPAGPRCPVDGHARRRAHARPRPRDRIARARQAGRRHRRRSRPAAPGARTGSVLDPCVRRARQRRANDDRRRRVARGRVRAGARRPRRDRLRSPPCRASTRRRAGCERGSVVNLGTARTRRQVPAHPPGPLYNVWQSAIETANPK